MRAYFVILGLVVGAPVLAATGPAEVPPASYSEASYIDSEGCAFVRAEVGGRTTWVARLDASRQPVCGKAPSLASPLKLDNAVPVSYAPLSSATKPTKPAFRPAWDDGRLNPMRGPRSAAGDAAMRSIWTDGVPMNRR